MLKRLKTASGRHTDITTLIGVEFDDNTVWGQLTILELKVLIGLALKRFEDAKEGVEAFLQYNDNGVERGLFYQALNVSWRSSSTTSWRSPTTRAISAACSATGGWMLRWASVDGSAASFGLTTSMKLGQARPEPGG